MAFSLTSHASSQIRSQLTVNAHLCLLEPSQVYTNSALIHSLCVSLSTLLTPPPLYLDTTQDCINYSARVDSTFIKNV